MNAFGRLVAASARVPASACYPRKEGCLRLIGLLGPARRYAAEPGRFLVIDASVAFTLVLGLLALVVAGIIVRRRLLDRGGGTIECAVRAIGSPWRYGVGRYNGDQLRWYRIFDLRPGPRVLISRRAFEITARRRTDARERVELGEDLTVIECRSRGAPLDLAMNDPALTGFLAWLEAGPPGAHLIDRRVS